MKAAEWVGRGGADNATAFASVATPGVSRRPVLTRVAASFSGTATKLLQLYEGADNRSFVKGTLAIDATPEQFKTTTTAWFLIAGAGYAKAAATGIAFSAAHVVSASKFGIILIQTTSGGTVSTKVPAATATTPMAYDSIEAARSAKPAPDSGKAELGYILIAADAGGWTAITDDLTDGSDLVTATFVDATEGTLRDELYVVNGYESARSCGLRALAKDRCFIAVLAASGAGGTLSKVSVEGYHEAA